MKWAKLVNDPELNGIPLEDRNASFMVYSKIAPGNLPGGPVGGGGTLEGTPAGTSTDPKKYPAKNPKKDIFRVWKTYHNSKPYKETLQKSYELFCGGWLHFYDRIVRNKKTKHTVYFVWNQKDQKGQYTVTIWISPPSIKNRKSFIKYVDPPPATDPPNPPPPPPPARGRS